MHGNGRRLCERVAYSDIASDNLYKVLSLFDLIVKRTSIILFLLAAVTASLVAQTTYEEVTSNLDKSGGVYYAYPVTEALNTPVPAGYEPFYISHFSRHGSRYLIADEDLDRVVDVFAKAHDANALTPLGEDVRGKLLAFQTEMSGRGGELTPLGERQHRAIAGRMYEANPGIFTDDAVITAVSTPVMRCAYSMMAFTEALKERNPRLTIPRESSNRHLAYLNYHSPESNEFNSESNTALKQGLKDFKDKMTRPDRLMDTLFSDKDYLHENVDAPELMWGLYWVASDLQNTEQGTSLYDIFTPAELFDLWQVFNYDFYIHNTSYPKSRGLHVDNANRLLTNIIDTANDYVADGRKGATLRFAHDGNLIPLAARMLIDGTYGMENRPDSLYKSWANFKVSPMAGNIQIILYRNVKDASKPILAKVMLNEREVSLPGKPFDFPFYRWEDLKEHLVNMTHTPFDTLVPDDMK